MIKLATLVLLIFNLDFINSNPVSEISEKYSEDDPELNHDPVISEVESAIKNLMKERARSLDIPTEPRSIESPAGPRLSLEGLNDIRKAVTAIDLDAVLVTNAIFCFGFIHI